MNLSEEEWQLFTDLADISAGRLPRDLTEAEIVAKLPVILPVLRGEVDEATLRELVDLIAKS